MICLSPSVRHRSISAVSASVLTVLSLLSACGSSKPSASPPVEITSTTVLEGQALTVAEATTLSRLLFQNFDKGGADVLVDVPYGTQSTVQIEGVVDWKTHTGRAEVKVVKLDGAVVSSSTVYWRDLYDAQKAIVATTLDGLTEAMAAKGNPGITFVARPFSEASPLDRVLRYLDGLATAQAENPLLMRQDAKAQSLGVETVTSGGATVEAMALRYGKSRYWADPKNGRMLQASAPLAGLETETVFHFTNHGTKTVELPRAETVIDASTIPELYGELTKRK
jgi:hypothetical protein